MGQSLSSAGALPRNVIEIFTIVAATLVIVLHAKRRKRRMTFIPFDIAVDSGGLAQQAVNSIVAVTMGRDFYAVGVKADYALDDFGTTSSILTFGWAHSDLSNVEIQENIDSSNAGDPDNIIAREIARRPVRTVGKIDKDGVFNDGRQMKRALKFAVGESHALTIWVQNNDAITTAAGSEIRASGVIYGRFY